MGNQGWTEDAFGSFKIVVTADKSRKIGREGSKFVYDDSTDHIIRMLWPQRVQDYIHFDIDREQRRLEDIAARKHFEEMVQIDRLANPSSTHPGLAASRPSASNRRSNANGPSSSRSLSTRLIAPPLKLTQPIQIQDLPKPRGSMKLQRHHVLVMPIHHASSDDMRSWAEEEGLMQEVLPALMKPYFVLPVTHFSVTALKQLLAEILQRPAFWHDSSHHYPATDEIEADDIALYIDWSTAGLKTPNSLLQTELPDDEAVQALPQMGKELFSMWSIIQWMSRQDIEIMPSFDLIYCMRPPRDGGGAGVSAQL